MQQSLMDELKNGLKQEQQKDQQNQQLSKVLEQYGYTLDIYKGKGSFATVWKAYDQQKNPVAIKIVDKQKQREMAIQNVAKELQEETLKYFRNMIFNEIQIMMSIKNENVVNLINFFDDTQNWYYVLEYCSEDVSKYLLRETNGQGFDEKTAVKYFNQFLNGLNAINMKGYVHRDLKPDNILIEKGILKISDFGFSKSINISTFLSTYIGTPQYMAPEILQEKKYDHKVDIWSAGIILFQMIFVILPFKSSKNILLRQTELCENGFSVEKCVENHGELIKKKAQNLSREMKDLLKQIFVIDPKNRIDYDQLSRHPALNQESNISNSSEKKIFSSRNISSGKNSQKIFSKFEIDENSFSYTNNNSNFKSNNQSIKNSINKQFNISDDQNTKVTYNSRNKSSHTQNNNNNNNYNTITQFNIGDDLNSKVNNNSRNKSSHTQNNNNNYNYNYNNTYINTQFNIGDDLNSKVKPQNKQHYQQKNNINSKNILQNNNNNNIMQQTQIKKDSNSGIQNDLIINNNLQNTQKFNRKYKPKRNNSLQPVKSQNYNNYMVKQEYELDQQQQQNQKYCQTDLKFKSDCEIKKKQSLQLKQECLEQQFEEVINNFQQQNNQIPQNFQRNQQFSKTYSQQSQQNQQQVSVMEKRLNFVGQQDSLQSFIPFQNKQQQQNYQQSNYTQNILTEQNQQNSVIIGQQDNLQSFVPFQQKQQLQQQNQNLQFKNQNLFNDNNQQQTQGQQQSQNQSNYIGQSDVEEEKTDQIEIQQLQSIIGKRMNKVGQQDSLQSVIPIQKKQKQQEENMDHEELQESDINLKQNQQCEQESLQSYISVQNKNKQHFQKQSNSQINSQFSVVGIRFDNVGQQDSLQSVIPQQKQQQQKAGVPDDSEITERFDSRPRITHSQKK